MARLAVFDELNTLEKKTDRAVPSISDYFSEMDLPSEKIEDRINLASLLQPVFTFLFFTASSMYAEGTEIDYAYLYSLAQRRYTDALNDFRETLSDDNKIKDRIVDISQDIVNVTIDRITDEYYTSDDRATFIAENEANTLLNYDDLLEAIEEGYTMKRWVSMRDNKVRRDHAEVDGTEIPINEYFLVGSSEMMYPCDMDADPEETVNCRCTVEYF